MLNQKTTMKMAIASLAIYLVAGETWLAAIVVAVAVTIICDHLGWRVRRPPTA